MAPRASCRCVRSVPQSFRWVRSVPQSGAPICACAVAVRQKAARPSSTVAVRVIRISLCGYCKKIPTLHTCSKERGYLSRAPDSSHRGVRPAVEAERGPAVRTLIGLTLLELRAAKCGRGRDPVEKQMLVKAAHQGLGGFILVPPVRCDHRGCPGL